MKAFVWDVDFYAMVSKARGKQGRAKVRGKVRGLGRTDYIVVEVEGEKFPAVR